MKKLTFKFLILIISLASFFPPGAFAQELKNPLKFSTISGAIVGIINFLLSLIVPLAILVSLWATIILMTAAGNPQQIKKAQEALKWAVIGVAIVIIAQGFLQLVIKEIGGISSLTKLIDRVSYYLRMIGGPIAIVMFLYGSLLLSTATPENIKKAYKIFLWTAVAIAIILIATVPNLINLLSQLLK